MDEGPRRSPWQEHSPVPPAGRPHTGGHLQVSLAGQPSGRSGPTGETQSLCPNTPEPVPEGRGGRLLHPDAPHVGSSPAWALGGSATSGVRHTVQLSRTCVVFAGHRPGAGFTPGPGHGFTRRQRLSTQKRRDVGR